tara:strand:+ start:294 stop:1073 length:780 start_codon:yes stop_codon:yes gene_type:complete
MIKLIESTVSLKILGFILLPITMLGSEILAEETLSRYEFLSSQSFEGIKKSYMGREIAHVMHYKGADWLERPGRDQEEQSSLLLDLLGLKEGYWVADIGAGSGYFSLPIARLLGIDGRLLAVDIQPEMLHLIRDKARWLAIDNIDLILASATEPRLPEESLDLVLMVDVYHEFSHPWEMMVKICRALKTGGRVVFVEYRGEDPSIPIKPLHKMTEIQVLREMSLHPLKWLKTLHVLPRQHVIFFEKIASRNTSSAESPQ